jgi:succinate dehydrogenase/fumarate reductase flavoprotein subunit
MSNSSEIVCDVLVVGSGGAGFTAAVTARKAGLDVLLIEKEALLGGTTATSGGMLWIPGNPHSSEVVRGRPVEEAVASARSYIVAEGGNYINPTRLDAFLENGPRMISFLEQETEVKFYGMDYPDYYSEQPEAGDCRGIGSMDYELAKLGNDRAVLKNQLPQMLFMGLAIGSSVEMKEFMRAGRSIKSMGFVVKRMLRHFYDVARYGHDEQVVRGRALIARFIKSARDLGIPLWLSSPMKELVKDASGRVTGALVSTPKGQVHVTARKGVILAAGGYAEDEARRKATYPPLGSTANHATVAAPGNTGDGIAAAEKAGGAFNGQVANVGAWMPVSVIPSKTGFENTWPHLVDRQKPGFIAVDRRGNRFVDESASYHHFVPPMMRVCAEAGDSEACCWLVASKPAVDKWGMGFVRPFPVPRGNYVRNGYLIKANTIAELASKAGIDPAGLEATVQKFNGYARTGKDLDFKRGERTYDLYQGDEEVGPNPCLGGIEKGPFYAVKIVPGEIGTFAGLATDEHARVLDTTGAPIPGLYAAGNDQASVFGGVYPGPGSTLGPALTFGYVAARHIASM